MLFVNVRHGVFGFFFFKQKTAYEMLRSLVGSEMCIRDRCGWVGVQGAPSRYLEVPLVGANTRLLLTYCNKLIEPYKCRITPPLPPNSGDLTVGWQQDGIVGKLL
eukprot:TRINITY_DN47169_c0_g1_i1.p1 TRINITY_DN47169_c0_g1~~TRINITY_DN47169_c0_g1_i1.p1  ORF type:complete len:105 (+),score=24.52 TRINITY_DN47169_c0_g1_i1:17-331(+)